VIRTCRQMFSAEVHREIKNWLASRGAMAPWGIDDVFGRRFLHNPVMFVKIHRQLEGHASEIFGEPVKASYCYVSRYGPSGKCPLHLDRPQCRFTIDYLIDQTMPHPWTILIGPEMTDDEVAAHSLSLEESERDNLIRETRWSAVSLHPNDAVCYSGTHQWHFRPPIASGGHSADLVFFHFVPESFDGVLD
jgi:hypothetical protein